MKQLIDLFNKKYGKQYGVIDDSFSNEDTYKIYKIIKTLCSDDKEIMTVLEKVKLPEPKTAKESIEKIDMYTMIEILNGSNETDNSNTIEQCLNFNTEKRDNKIYININDIDMASKYVINGGKIHIIGKYESTFGNIRCELSSIINKDLANEDAYDINYYDVSKFISIKYSVSMLMNVSFNIDNNNNLSSISVILTAYDVNGNISTEANLMTIDAIYFEKLPKFI